MMSPMRFFQPLGRALMLPIAVLPVAGLLLRLGQPDLLDIAFLSAAGDALFANLGLLFAVGVATGFARDGNGAASLAALTCYLIATRGAQALLVPPDAIGAGMTPDAAKAMIAAWGAGAIHRFDVPVGILSGLVGGLFYNRFATLKLPDYLAFFGGRRFVPIVSGVAGLALAAVLGLAQQPLESGVDALSTGVAASGGVGLFVFGVLNRLLLVTGLHHILNNIVWLVVGSYDGKTGDLSRFFAGDPSAGVFMSGFFPIMMFGLPAACLAMYTTARPDRRKATGGMLASLALTSFLTGVTEPIEFSFMFLAPVLFAVHAVLTGLSMVLMAVLDVHLGFGFSAGLFDYVLNYGKATRPLLLLPVGAAYAALYFGLFRYVILRFDLQTPGRERDTPAGSVEVAPGVAASRGAAYVAALGGAANIAQVDACATRLRLTVADAQAIDEPALRRLGAHGVLRPSATNVQVVVGPVADIVAMEMRGALDAVETAPVAAPPAAVAALPPALLVALGGDANLVTASRHAGRWRVELRDTTAIDATALPGVRATATPALGVLHLLMERR